MCKWGAEVNKFEKVSSDGHKMSLAKSLGLGGPEVPCPGLGGGGVLRSHVWRGLGQSLYSEVQWDPHFWTGRHV